MNIYILNPGDGKVCTFSDVHMAFDALDAAEPHGRLYHYQSAGVNDWQMYAGGHWYVANPDNLPIKILEVVR